MSTFTTSLAAHDWARAYGYNYTYRVELVKDGQFAGLYVVQWNYREPHDC